MDLVSLLILLIVAGIAIGIIQQIPGLATFRWVAFAILGLFLIMWLLQGQGHISFH